MKPSIETSSVSIEADADSVWKVLADEFLNNAVWAPGVISSGPNPNTPDGINGSRYGGRVSDVEGLGTADIRLVAYDAPLRMLSYTLEAEGLPPFVEKLQNTWTVNPDGERLCTVDTQVEVTIADAMAGTDTAEQVIANMFAKAAGAPAGLKTYIEGNHDKENQ